MYKFISPSVHAVLDYVAALALLVLPFVLHLQHESALVFWFSIVAGAALLSYSLLTNYRFNWKPVISYSEHLMLDALASASFLLLAWLHQGSWLSVTYCLVMGGGVILVILCSEKEAVVHSPSA